MKSYLLSGIGLSLCLALALPAAAQSTSPTGNQGSYQPHGEDYGYDNMKADTGSSKAANELAAGADLVKAQKYADAIPHLEHAASRNPRDVTALIYLGFAHRMLASGLTGDAQSAEFDKALSYYQKALTIDSGNKLLHEYLGKLYLLRRDYTSAGTELTTLETLCPSGCSERTALTQAIAANPAPPKQP